MSRRVVENIVEKTALAGQEIEVTRCEIQRRSAWMPFNLLQTCFTFTTSNLQSCLIVERAALAETIRLFKKISLVKTPSAESADIKNYEM